MRHPPSASGLHSFTPSPWSVEMRESPIAKEIFSRADVIKRRLKMMSHPSYKPIEIPDPRFLYREVATCWQEPLEAIQEIPTLEEDASAACSLPGVIELIKKTTVNVSLKRRATAMRPEVYFDIASKVQIILKDVSVEEALEIAAALNAGSFVADKWRVEDICKKIRNVCLDNDVLLQNSRVDVNTQVFELRLVETKPTVVPELKTPPCQIVHCHFSEKGSIWDQLEQEQRINPTTTPESQKITQVVSPQVPKPRMTTIRSPKVSVADYGSPFFGTQAEKLAHYDELIPLDRWSAAATYNFRRRFYPSGFNRGKANCNALYTSPGSEVNPFLATASKAMQKRRLLFFGVEARVDSEGKTSFVDSTRPYSTWVDIKTVSRIPRPFGRCVRAPSPPPTSEPEQPDRQPERQSGRQPRYQLECRAERQNGHKPELANSARAAPTFQRRFLF
ncbi:hypothetical protein DFP73DRAFT_524670 [Morchella snyderi]|nr:hypothetical protein DFP73DRAFT_524670 [Morchella snyderi]